MNTFDELLNLVATQPLSRGLALALGIAITLPDEELASWIKLELMGYVPDNPAIKEVTVVPQYREVSGSWYDDYGRQMVVSDPRLAFVNVLWLWQGVAELEGIETATEELAMRATEFSELLREHVGVEVSVFRFHPSAVRQVLHNIRVHLLDRLAGQRERISAIPDVPASQKTEILQLKPSFHGISIDLKELWRQRFGPKK
jgi:hypothetical protein